MDEIGGGPIGSPGLIDRVKAILLKPNDEWSKIDVEPTTIGDLYRGYVIPLAAIGPVCSLIGMQIFGLSFFGITYRPSILSGITTAVIQYVFALAMVYVLAVLIDVLAPNFSGTSNRTQAFKVAAYSGAKAAVSNFTQWLAVHLGQSGIRVNAIAPGFFITEQNRDLMLQKDGSYTPRAEKVIAQTPMKRFGEAEELIGALLWLVEPKASGFVTGSIIAVDGGFSAYSGV